MNDSVHLRNARALAEGADAARVRVDELLLRIQHLERQFVMSSAEIVALRQQLTVLLVSRGHGPTVKE